MNQAEIKDRISVLPLRSAVVLATRCARRLEPLSHNLTTTQRYSIAKAIRIAEALAQCSKQQPQYTADDAIRIADSIHKTNRSYQCTSGGEFCKIAAANSALSSAFLYTASSHPISDNTYEFASRSISAAYSQDKVIIHEINRDIQTLIELQREAIFCEPHDLGKTIDPTENGPLGPIWKSNAPKWFVESRGIAQNSEITQTQLRSPIVIVWDPKIIGLQDYNALISEIDKLVKSCGGMGIMLESQTEYKRPPTADLPASASPQPMPYPESPSKAASTQPDQESGTPRPQA